MGLGRLAANEVHECGSHYLMDVFATPYKSTSPAQTPHQKAIALPKLAKMVWVGGQAHSFHGIYIYISVFGFISVDHFYAILHTIHAIKSLQISLLIFA